MGQIKGIKYGYNDINIVPETTTTVKSRSQVNPYDKNGMLPIFASPMDTVVSVMNYETFNRHNIYAVIPRTYSLDFRCSFLENNDANEGTFVAFSLKEVKNIFIDNIEETKAAVNVLHYLKAETSFTVRICIDIANGHMTDLIKTIKEIKDEFGEQVIIMAGNIANPETYREYEEAGCDYVRVSIGTGEGCSTSTYTGIHYPIFSLLQEMWKIKESIGGKCKIIADGGIKSYGDIQKALIYADYVMIGGLFSQLVESAGEIKYGKFYWKIRGKKILRPLKTLFYYNKTTSLINWEKMKNGTIEYFKVFRGMSTQEAQESIKKGNNIKDNKPLKPSEGFVKKLKIKSSIREFEENETAYLKSMMSYINARRLDEIKDALWVAKQTKTHN